MILSFNDIITFAVLTIFLLWCLFITHQMRKRIARAHYFDKKYYHDRKEDILAIEEVNAEIKQLLSEYKKAKAQLDEHSRTCKYSHTGGVKLGHIIVNQHRHYDGDINT